MPIDLGKTAADYSRHRAGFPDRFFDRLFEKGLARVGNRVLDVGTGTGTIARGLALRGLNATGLDPSHELMEKAARLDRLAGVEVEYVVARIEDHARNPSLDAASFDLITAGQCWHWFERDKAAMGAHRLLISGGRLVIAHFDWVPLPGNVAAATERLVGRYNPAWFDNAAGGNGLYPVWLRDVAEAGFTNVATESFDVDTSYSHPGWRGRIRACAGVGASLDPATVEAFDTDLEEMLAKDFPQEPLAIQHRVFILSCRKPG
ncbi:MAG: class I SAM-dependent methyltransferase [Acidimicrobiia bacterium]